MSKFRLPLSAAALLAALCFSAPAAAQAPPPMGLPQGAAPPPAAQAGPPPAGPMLKPLAPLVKDAPKGEPSGKRRKSRGKGILVVETNPPGAKVIIDGKKAGKSPVTVEKVKSGWASIGLRHEDQADVDGFAEVSADEVTRLQVNLPPAVGHLTVTSPRANTQVSVNGQNWGTAPLTIKNLSPGDVQLRLTAQLDTLDKTVKIKKGKTTLFKARFPKIPRVSVRIRQQAAQGCEYLNAEIVLDDKKAGVVPNGGEIVVSDLVPGEHDYRLEIRGRCGPPGNPEAVWRGSGKVMVAAEKIFNVGPGSTPGEVMLR